MRPDCDFPLYPLFCCRQERIGIFANVPVGGVIIIIVVVILFSSYLNTTDKGKRQSFHQEK